MRMAFDASAFAKRYIEEPGSDAVETLLQQASELGLCVLCVPEIISALNRRRREGAVTPAQYQQIKAVLSVDVADAMVLNLTPAVVAEATHLLENNVLRAMDALHVACAVNWQADVFVSADERQLVAAKNAGLRVEAV